MTTTHTLSIVGICPVDDSHDIYELTVTTEDLLPVEKILAAVKMATRGAAYQEDIAVAIATELCDYTALVRMVGHHSGVKTVCEA